MITYDREIATLIKSLMDFIVQVTDHKYIVSVLRNNLLYMTGCSLFPHAL